MLEGDHLKLCLPDQVGMPTLRNSTAKPPQPMFTSQLLCSGADVPLLTEGALGCFWPDMTNNDLGFLNLAETSHQLDTARCLLLDYCLNEGLQDQTLRVKLVQIKSRCHRLIIHTSCEVFKLVPDKGQRGNSTQFEKILT